MASKRATSLVWMMAVAMVAVMVAENGRMCLAIDMEGAKDSVMNKAEEAKDTAGSWSSWALNKITGKLSVDPTDMKQRADDMMTKVSDTATDAENYASGKVHAVSHSQMTPEEDNTGKFYVKAKEDVGGSYNAMAREPVTES